jgi:hypothetical protein
MAGWLTGFDELENWKIGVLEYWRIGVLKIGEMRNTIFLEER